MKSAITAILKNLQALKSDGVERIVVADETLDALKQALAGTLDSPESPSTATLKNLDSDIRNKPANSTQSAKPSVPAETPFPPPPKITVPAEGTKAERLDALRKIMLADKICQQHCHTGKNLVFGAGNPNSAVFFCGEAPGAEEEEQGEPFVGPAGQLLTKIIAATGMTRESVYIGNIMKWRPEMPTAIGNRPPTESEMAYCLPYVAAQIEIIQPQVIVALGLTAVNGLLGNDPNRKMGTARGTQFDFHGIPLIPTYHPSYLLRSGTMKSKRMVWEDFMAMMRIIDLPISEKQRGYFLPKM